MSLVDPLLTEIERSVADLNDLGRRANIALLYGCRRVIKELVISNTRKMPPTEFLYKTDFEAWENIGVTIGKNIFYPNRAQEERVEDAKRFLVSPQEKWRIFVHSGAGLVDSLDLTLSVDFLNDFRRLGLIKCLEKWRKMIDELPEALACQRRSYP